MKKRSTRELLSTSKTRNVSNRQICFRLLLLVNHLLLSCGVVEIGGKCRRAHLSKTIAKCTRVMMRMTMDDISSKTCHAHAPRIHISYSTIQCLVSGDIFTSHAVFWRARRVSQNTRDELKYPTILHTKPPNKRFIILLEMF